MLIELLVFFPPLRPITNSDWKNDRVVEFQNEVDNVIKVN
jgi:hypothetical protein